MKFVGQKESLLSVIAGEVFVEIYKKQRLQHKITKAIVFLMPIFRTGKTVIHRGNENTVKKNLKNGINRTSDH